MLRRFWREERFWLIVGGFLIGASLNEESWEGVLWCLLPAVMVITAAWRRLSGPRLPRLVRRRNARGD